MDIQTLNCNSCGAPLRVSRRANFVTCNHCQAQLKIERTESTAFTEQLDHLATNQDQMIAKLERLERESDLAKLDRQWEQEKEQYMVTGKHGHKRLPTSEGSILSTVVIAVFGLFFMFVAARAAPPMMIVGVLVVATAVGIGVNGQRKSEEYRKAYEQYRQKRGEIHKDR